MTNVRILVPLLPLVGSCAWQPYDPKDPTAYRAYWSKEANKRNSLLYLLTDERERCFTEPTSVWGGQTDIHLYHCQGVSARGRK